MSRFLFPFLSLVLLSSCTVSLFPEYDAKIIQKIEEANGQAQVLFATVERGSPVSEFASLEPKYNEVIGGLSAVLLQVQARPQPHVSQRLLNSTIGRKAIQDFCNESENVTTGDPRSCFMIVTPFSLSEARETIANMRDAHERLGLGPVLAENYVNLFNTSIEQALTVEAALVGSSGGSQ